MAMRERGDSIVEETPIERGPRTIPSGDALPEEIDAARMGRNPVLFLPGFLRLNALTSTMRRRLKGLDFEVYTMRPPFLGSGDLRRYAQALREKMREMRVLLGARKLSLIGQGTGGLAGVLGYHGYLLRDGHGENLQKNAEAGYLRYLFFFLRW